MTNTINHIFHPFQPVVQPADESEYIEVCPDRRLSEYICCYWRLRSCKVLNRPFIYRVIPDGCIDIFFDVNNMEDSRIMGFSTTFTKFDLGYSFDYAGIRFMPGALPFIFDVNASTLTNRHECLNDVIPAFAAHLNETMRHQNQFGRINKAFDQYFLHRIESLKGSRDLRLINAVSVILKSHGTLNLNSDLDTGVSSRQLRRLCEFYVGASPKTFGKVIRFQYFFHLLKSSSGCTSFNKVLYDAGYYDQPHFTKEFKSFFGLTPSQVFNL